MSNRRCCFLLRWSPSRLRTSVNISVNIDIALSTTPIIRPKRFAPLVAVAVESAIKQIGRRVQISGAQWKADNVTQVLAQRTAYLSGLYSRKG